MLARKLRQVTERAHRLRAALPEYIYTYTYVDQEALMAADLSAMTTELEEIGAVLDAALAFVNGVPSRQQAAVDAALAGSASPEQLAGVQLRVDALGAKADEVAAAMARVPVPA